MDFESYDMFRRYERTGWKIAELPWSEIARDAVEPEYVRLARSAIMGECNSIAALHGFLNESVDDYDFGAFASLWGYEELRHHYAFRAWLRAIGDDVDTLPVRETRPPYPPGGTVTATLCTNIISELTVLHAYRALSERVREPVLARIMLLASADEGRHASAFAYFAGRRLKHRPEERASALETLYFYVADKGKIKHPVSVFKGKQLEVYGQETIDDGFEYLLAQNESVADVLRSKIYSVFSALTGFSLQSPKDVRKALAMSLESAPKERS